MKFACIFCGHVRSWSLCGESIIRHVIEPTGSTVGAATYATRGYNVHDGRDWGQPSSSDLQEFASSTACASLDISSNTSADAGWTSRCPKAHAWAIRQDRLKVPHLRLPGVQAATALSGAVGMFDCWRRGIDALRAMEESCGKFDAVIRMRFDLNILRTPDWNRIEDEISAGRLVSPDFCNFSAKGGCNDQFFVAPRNEWLKAMAISEKLEEYCCIDGVELHPETIFGHHLRACGVETVKMPIDFVIRRLGGGTHDLRRAKG